MCANSSWLWEPWPCSALPFWLQGRGGGRGGIGQLAQNKSVQEELKVKEDTATKIKEAVDKIREDNKDDIAKLRDRNTPQEDRACHRQEAEQSLRTKFLSRTSSALIR